MGDLSLENQGMCLGIFGFLLISVLIVCAQMRGAILVGIWAMALLSWVVGLQTPPMGLVSLPSVDYAFALDFSAWAEPGSSQFAGMLVGTAVLLFVALFDLAGVQYGLASIAGLLREGAVPRSTGIFASAGLGTIAGSLLGTSPVIVANESSSGIMEGARTGISALVTSALFALSAFIAPLLVAVPHVATAVPLILIGAFMMAPCADIDWNNLRKAIPSFLTITIVPFTYSIHNGILAGIFMDLLLSFLGGRHEKPDDDGKNGAPETPRSDDSDSTADSVCEAQIGKLLADLEQLSITRTKSSEGGLRRGDLLRKALEAYLATAPELCHSSGGSARSDSTSVPSCI